MAAVFFHHVVGDLTVGKPELAELHDADTLHDAARAIAASPEGAVPVWRPRASTHDPPSGARFIGMISALDIAAFVAHSGAGDRALRAVVAEVVQPNPGLLREIDPGTRLIDALELMRHGAKRFLVRKSGTWTGFTKRFSALYNGKWLKNVEPTSSSTASGSRQQSSSASSSTDKFCCLAREDVLRFLIGCLGALAPIPLTQISSLGAINPHYCHVEASVQAMEALQKIPQDPCAVAVVETAPDGTRKILGDISTYKLWKCDYVSAAWALANLSAGQFVIGADENVSASISVAPEPTSISSSPVEEIGSGRSPRAKKFSSRSIGFQANQMTFGRSRSVYHRGRSTPLTCRSTSSLAAVMAQMLSHRATHVWVTDAESEDDGVLVGVVGYTEIFYAVTRSAGPSPTTS